MAAGESYEVCLTDQISTDAAPDPFHLYKTLRRANPAPFAAYLKLGEAAIVSSSPERFLSVDRERRVEARPIKGTSSRAADPERDAALRAELTEDEKTYAEHLMIVDLLRNDLGRVCEVGSVGVPELMVVEDYATVHQLISTVSGVLAEERSAAECARACFPGGSMTGAPKERTMEIIDDIEAEARGVYSGAIGWFGVDGSMDLSIVIRTIVMRPGADDDRRRRGDRHAVRPGRRVRRDPAQGAGADGGDRQGDDRQRLAGRLVGGAGAAGGGARGGMTEPSASAPGALDRPGVAADPQDPPGDRRGRPRGDGGDRGRCWLELGGEGPSSAELEAAVRELIGRPEAGLLLVADAGGEIVGVLAASWQFAVHVPGRYATIQDLWVLPAWRSRSIGHDLVMALVREAGERGVRRLEVGLPKETFARIGATEAFYRVNGFQHLGPRMRRLI